MLPLNVGFSKSPLQCASRFDSQHAIGDLGVPSALLKLTGNQASTMGQGDHPVCQQGCLPTQDHTNGTDTGLRSWRSAWK